MSWRRGGATTSKPLPPPTDDDAGSTTPLKWADLTLRSWPDHHNDAFGSGAASTAHHLPTMELSTASKVGLSLALGCFLVTVAYFAVGGTGPAGLIHGGTRPPNIVFYLSDDQGYNSVKEEVTPYLKGLQTAGVTLTKYYAQEACAPTRMALLTGRYPLSIGIPENELAASKQEGLPLDETTFPEVLQRAGYTTYMLGKWNLGNASPRYLPTARGFDYFLGFLNGYQFYWSKLLPDQTSFRDLAYADKDCFYMYDKADVATYSTHFYRDKAVAAVASHDFDRSPMFLYLAFQAVHNPYADTAAGVDYPAGVPDSYLNASVLAHIEKRVKGITAQQYFKALAIMDGAVEAVTEALAARGVLDNTYIIFASDNGGCPTAGARNAPLRGTKGSLFEGGVRVEAFVYSPLLPSAAAGTTYSHIFHVSDWFPTLLDVAGVTYTVPAGGHRLDGVSHHRALLASGTDDADADAAPPRDHLLVNYYYDPVEPTKTLWTGKAFAIRNAQYKLMHTYDNKWSATWSIDEEIYEFDDDFTQYGGCSVTTAVSSGTFKYWLFDLDADPYEKENLYGLSDAYVAVQDELYAKLDEYVVNARTGPALTENPLLYVVWEENYNYVVPWDPAEDTVALPAGKSADASYPAVCGLFSQSVAGKTATFAAGE